MDTSADENNSGVFPTNKTGEVHCCISLISLNKINKTKQNLQSRKMPSAFSNRRLQAEENSVNKAHGITIQIL